MVGGGGGLEDFVVEGEAGGGGRSLDTLCGWLKNDVAAGGAAGKERMVKLCSAVGKYKLQIHIIIIAISFQNKLRT